MKRIYLTTLLVIAILLVVNLLSNEFHLRFDLTEERQYTLSDATENVLEDLEEPVTIKAYFSKNLPPHIDKTRRDFQEMLIEYSNLSDGMVQYEFINPNEKETTENEVVQKGIQPVLINVRDKDEVKQQKAYLGAIISLGEKQEIIPFIQPEAAMEYALTTAIKKISVVNKPTIGFLQGHGEPPLSELLQLDQQLQVLYNTQEITFTDTSDIPESIKTLVVIRPTDTLRENHLSKLDAFLARGGRVALAINRVDGNLQNMYGAPISTGLDSWLKQKGLEVDASFITDAKCASVTVPQQIFSIQVPVPYVPIVGRFAEHPITTGLETVMLEFASPVKFTGNKTIEFTPLIFSSEKSNEMPAPQYFDLQKEWSEADFPKDGIVMGAALEGKLSGQTKSKLVVIADGDFPVNGPPQQGKQLQPDNINLLANSIDWLSDDTGLISLRTKGVTSRPIAELDDSTKATLKYLNFALPLILVIAYGFVRFQQNRIKRLKRMSLDYEKD